MTFVSTIAYITIHNLILHTFVVTSLSTNYRPILVVIAVTAAANSLSTYYMLSYITSFNHLIGVTCIISFISYYNSMRHHYVHFNKEDVNFYRDYRICTRSCNHVVIQKLLNIYYVQGSLPTTQLVSFKFRTQPSCLCSFKAVLIFCHLYTLWFSIKFSFQLQELSTFKIYWKTIRY